MTLRTILSPKPHLSAGYLSMTHAEQEYSDDREVRIMSSDLQRVINERYTAALSNERNLRAFRLSTALNVVLVIAVYVLAWRAW